MNLLRIAFKHAPKQTAAVMKKINKCDMQINALAGKLSKQIINVSFTNIKW